MEIEISYLSSAYNTEQTIQKIENTDINYIHVDVMDGVFVQNKTAEPSQIINILKNTSKKLDIHLMVKNVEFYIQSLAILNPEYITIHLELEDEINLNKIIELIKSYNIKVGLAIKPQTDIKQIDSYLALIDQVLIMSVEPGWGGQQFMPEVLTKIAYLNSKKILYNFKINIDGGINLQTIGLLKNLNLDYIVSGSFICQSADYQKQIDLLKKNITS